MTFDPVWLEAPLPALLVAAAGAGVPCVVKGNAAALAWARGAGLSFDALEAWASAHASALPEEPGGATEHQVGGQCLRCVPLRWPQGSAGPGGVLLWLQPLAAAADDGEAARAAQRAIDFLERALMMAGVSVWRIDPVTQRIHFNVVGFDVSGIVEDPAGIPLDSMRDTIHPEDRARIVHAAQQALDGEGIVDAVARYRNVDGTWRTLLTRRIAERDPFGHPLGLAGVSIDLTPLSVERERSQALADRTRLVADALGVGFWSRDIESGVEYWDEQLYRIHDRPRTLGPPRGSEWVQACVHSQDQARMAQLAQRADEGHDPLTEAIFRIHDHAGQPRWVQTWACRTLRGGRRMVYGMTLDITERRAAEAAQAERQQLEQASREKSAFMARMSHELRTPMNAVLGFARLLETDTEQPPSQRQRERLAHIGNAGRQLMTLIDDLLETSQRRPAATTGRPAGGLHVLCIEDNAVNLQLVRELIALRPGVRLRTAVDGLSGVEAALQDRPHLVLVDLHLPDIDGTEVMRRLRAHPAMADSRIVALSADAMPHHIQAALAAGFDDYWTKPIQFDHFLAQIDRLAAEAPSS